MTTHQLFHISCPACGTTHEHTLYTSGNSFSDIHLEHWSDGHSDYGHCFFQTPYVKCRGCSNYFIAYENIDPRGKPPQPLSHRYVWMPPRRPDLSPPEPPEMEGALPCAEKAELHSLQIELALHPHCIDERLECHVRQWLFWVHNLPERSRCGPALIPIDNPVSEDELHFNQLCRVDGNTERLVELMLQQDAPNQMALGHTLKALGRFDEALEVYEAMDGEHPWKGLLLDLARAQNAEVVRMPAVSQQ